MDAEVQLEDREVGIEVDTDNGDLILTLDGRRYALTTTDRLRRRLREALTRSEHYGSGK